jgi:hypothetical protein
MDQAGVKHEFTDEERMTLTIDNNCLYRHQVLHINYTTYDNRRAQDTINPCTWPDIMTLSGENEEGDHAHPYWYACVLGIYHVRVLHTGKFSKCSQLQTMQFLHVRWFGHHVKHRSGWKACHLHRISFIDGVRGLSVPLFSPNRTARSFRHLPHFRRSSGRLPTLPLSVKPSALVLSLPCLDGLPLDYRLLPLFSATAPLRYLFG